MSRNNLSNNNLEGFVLLGMGNIGSCVLGQLCLSGFSEYRVFVLADSKHLVICSPTRQQLTEVLETKKDKKRIDPLSDKLHVEEVRALPNSIKSGDIVINAMPSQFPKNGSMDTAPDAVLYDILALEKGAHVVTAHKSAFGSKNLYEKVVETARRNMVKYIPTGAIMGPTRVVEVLLWLKENNISVVKARGIVNGTTGHILAEMYKGREYQKVLSEAVKLGIAEPDPTSDTMGYDALSKMKAVGMINGTYQKSDLFGIGDKRAGLPEGLQGKLKNSPYLGIEGITLELLKDFKREGYEVRLVCTYNSKTGVAQVGPEALRDDDPLLSVNGRQNMLVLELDGKIDLIRMLMQIYTKVTFYKGHYVARIEYPINSIPTKNPSNDGIADRKVREGYDIKFIYDTSLKYFGPISLTIIGPGAGNAETAAALLSVADRLKNH